MKYTHAQAEFLFNREIDMQRAAVKEKDHQALNVPLLLGPTGIGKTTIARDAAKRLNLPLMTINCGENADAADIMGIPVQKGDSTLHTHWVLNKIAASACLTPTFLLLDDIDKAPDVVQGALLSVTANRTFRDHKIHEGTIIACAGNGASDDILANELCESLRTRVTVINMHPDLATFTKHGVSSGTVHETILGYLQFKPEHLHKHIEDVPRFPTPRGWTEASKQLFRFPNPKEDIFQNKTFSNWKTIIALKCGDQVANDFWAWHEIISGIDIMALLTRGVFEQGSDPAERRMKQYASVFAVANHLNNKGVEKSYAGLEKWVSDIDAELRTAFIIQLKQVVRTKIAVLFPSTADMMAADLISTTAGLKARSA